MSTPVDPYRDWGAAYVLGSLSPAERREFEGHLPGCEACSGDVASFAGVPGILSAVPRDRALDLLGPDVGEPPAAVLAGLVAAERSRRRRARWLVAAALVGAVLLGWGVASAGRPPAPDASATSAAPSPAPGVELAQTVPSPVTASARLVAEPWGTRIEVRCSYAEPDGPPTPVFAYALHVVTADGASTRVATWTAGPGSTTLPIATTRLLRSEITGVEIRLAHNDAVLLRVDL
ncbi:zf-HC2 domain-containing protein [Actinosynnema sp. NPDC059797]